jgi:hypothetical protein
MGGAKAVRSSSGVRRKKAPRPRVLAGIVRILLRQRHGRAAGFPCARQSRSLRRKRHRHPIRLRPAGALAAALPPAPQREGPCFAGAGRELRAVLMRRTAAAGVSRSGGKSNGKMQSFCSVQRQPESPAVFSLPSFRAAAEQARRAGRGRAFAGALGSLSRSGRALWEAVPAHIGPKSA